jgi:hypothetical protein
MQSYNKHIQSSNISKEQEQDQALQRFDPQITGPRHSAAMLALHWQHNDC